jgi:hypothetical protein
MVEGRNIRSRRLPRGLLVGAAAATLVTGCAGSGGSGTTASGSSSVSSSVSPSVSPSVSSSVSSSASGPQESPLARGLLAPSAFGSSATVVSLTLQQFQQATSGKLGTAGGVTVDPPRCAGALRSTQTDPSRVKDLVAEAATTRGSDRGTVTVEAIATGALVDGAVDELNSAVQSCPEVTVRSGQLGRATVKFSKIDVSKIAEKAAAVQFTTTVTPPGHDAVTVPAVIGAVQDGDRLVLLLDAAASNGAASSSGTSAAPPDTAAFTSLLRKAYETERNALG